jgi:hypothetical protein
MDGKVAVRIVTMDEMPGTAINRAGDGRPTTSAGETYNHMTQFMRYMI